MRILIFVLLTSLLCLPTLAPAAEFGTGRDGKLDQSALKRSYKEAEWEQVTKSLEGYLRKRGDSRVDVDERIFAYKYLGVIYAADSLTRSKAESYFTRLLNLSTDVEIVDLYASKRVNELFDEVKSEHLRRQAYEQRLSNKGSPLAMPELKSDSMAPSNQPKSRSPQPIPSRGGSRLQEKNNQWVWWTVGIAAAAGIGAGAYYLTTQNDGEKTISTKAVKPPEP